MRGIIVFILMASTAQGSADHCVPLQRVQKARVVVQKHAQRVVHHAPVQKVVVKEVQRVVQDYGHSYSGLEHNYNDLGYQYRVGQNILDDAIADKVYNRLLRDGTLAALLVKVQVESLRAAGPRAEPSPEQGIPSGDPKVQALLTRSCVKCHGGDKPKAGLSFENADSIGALVRWKSYNAALTGEMPQGSGPLGDEEVDLLREWAATAE